MVEARILPCHAGFGKVQSLYLQGFSAWTTGIRTRPKFGNQERVFEVVSALLTNGLGLNQLPELFQMDEEDVWLDDMRRVETIFAERTRIAKLAMIRVRKKRKNMALEADNPAQG